MKYPAHVVGGITFGLYANHYVVQHLPIIQKLPESAMMSALFIAGSLVGSLLPDIDHRGSYLGRRFKVLSFIVSSTMGHRGGTHAPLITLFLTAITSWMIHFFTNGTTEVSLLLLTAGFMTGAFSHIFFDSLTISGVPLLYPISKKSFRLAKLRTGGIGEWLITAVMILLIARLVNQSEIAMIAKNFFSTLL